MTVLHRAAGLLRAQFASTVVLAGVIFAFCYLVVEPDRWGRATGIIAASLLVAFAFRLVLPTRLVGSLAVRGRVCDLLTYLVIGGVLLAVDIRLHR